MTIKVVVCVGLVDYTNHEWWTAVYVEHKQQ